MHKITSLELLRTPILLLVQLRAKYKKWLEATDAQKQVFLSEKKLLIAI